MPEDERFPVGIKKHIAFMRFRDAYSAITNQSDNVNFDNLLSAQQVY